MRWKINNSDSSCDERKTVGKLESFSIDFPDHIAGCSFSTVEGFFRCFHPVIVPEKKEPTQKKVVPLWS